MTPKKPHFDPVEMILEQMTEDLYQADIHGRIDPETLNSLVEGVIELRKLLCIISSNDISS
jgi:hypothetical protein